MIGPERLRELEPCAAGIRTLHVPTTGIADYPAVTRKYAEIVRQAGGVVLTETEVVGIARRGGEDAQRLQGGIPNQLRGTIQR